MSNGLNSIEGGTDNTTIGNVSDRLKVDASISTSGTTTSFVAAVTTTATNVPSSAGGIIEQVSIRCAVDQAFATRLEFSLDGGTLWHRLRVGEARDEEPKGGITQIKLRAAGVAITTANYEVIMNRAS